MSINTYCDSTFDGSNVTINGTSSNTVPALRVTESGDNLFEVGPTNSIAFRLGDIDGLGDETFIEGGYSDIKFKANSNTTAIFDANNRVTINSSTAGAYQLGVNGVIATTSAINWGMANLSSSPSFTMGVDATSGYLEIDEVTSGGTLKIGTDNTRIASNGVYLEGGLASATPSQYLGRVTGGGGGVMVGRTAAEVLADIGAAPATGGSYVSSVATGNGISGGTITSTGTLTVGAGDGLSQSSTGLLVDSTVVRTSGTQTIAGAKTFSDNLTMANTADLKFVDLAGTFPTSGKGFDWTLNNDGARIYAIQPSSDAIDLVFELRDNATSADRFVFHVNEWQGAAYDKYPLIIRSGTEFDLVDSSLYTDGTIRLSNAGALTVTSGTFSGDLTVNGGDITLGGTGRIQGVDTVSASTDAANKSYVDTAVAGAGSGTFLPLAGGTMTGLITDLETANDLVTGKTGAGNIYAKDSGNTFWQVFKSGSTTYMTAAGTSSDSIHLGAPTSSVTTNLTVSGNLQTGNTGDGSLTLKQSGTMFLQMFSTYSSSFINTGTSNSTIYFGNTSGLVQNVNVAGFLDADNFKINGAQGTSGQVLTSSGSGVSWQTPTTGTMSNWNLTADSGGSQSITQGTTVDIAGGTNITTTRTGATVSINNSITNNNQLTNGAGYTTNTGTITGSGASKQIAVFDSATGIASYSSLTRPSAGTLYTEVQYQVKPGATNASYSCTSDTDTGLGDFDGANGVSLVSKGVKNLTVKEGSTKFDQYTATAVSTTGSLNANQNNQAPTQDTLAQLCVDPSGNVVRGEQEGTWTFTRAELNATLGNTLIAAPGANKAIIVTESDWMVKYSTYGAVSGNQSYDVRQANIVQSAANISTLPGARINEIMNASQGTPVNPSYGFCARDIPLTTRTYKTNVATTLNKKTNDQLPAGLISISIKLKYRIFDATTF